MPDREKVIHAVETAFELWIDEYTGCSWFKEDEVRQAKEDAIAVLKEQEDMGKELTDAMELVRKKNERIEKLLKEQEAVVYCKDCKYGKIHGINVECIAHEEVGYDPEPWHPLEWFCADGERKEGR